MYASNSGEPGLTRSGRLNRVMTNMSSSPPSIAAKVSPSRTFMARRVPAPLGHLHAFYGICMPKCSSGRKEKKSNICGRLRPVFHRICRLRENGVNRMLAPVVLRWTRLLRRTGFHRGSSPGRAFAGKRYGLVALIAVVAAHGANAETLKVAVAQRGFWNSTFIDVGLKQGYFNEAGLELEILYTEGGASTLTPVIAGSIDIAMTNGVLGVAAAYAKGMPVKIISAEATGAADAFWYARPDSGITRLADTNGKTVAFSSPGSSSNLILLQLVSQAKVTPKLVATGGAPGTLTQVMSGQ